MTRMTLAQLDYHRDDDEDIDDDEDDDEEEENDDDYDDRRFVNACSRFYEWQCLWIRPSVRQ